MVIDANLVPKILELLSNAEFEVKKEAAWAIANMTDGGTPAQLTYLMQNVWTVLGIWYLLALKSDFFICKFIM